MHAVSSIIFLPLQLFVSIMHFLTKFVSEKWGKYIVFIPFKSDAYH